MMGILRLDNHQVAIHTKWWIIFNSLALCLLLYKVERLRFDSMDVTLENLEKSLKQSLAMDFEWLPNDLCLRMYVDPILEMYTQQWV